MKKLVAVLLIAVLAAAVFGCAAAPAPSTPTKAPAAPTAAPQNTDDPNGGGGDEPTEPEKIVTVTYLGPLSGPYATYGIQHKDGIATYVEMFEESGGFVNHPNWKLNMVYLDHELNAEVCMGLFERNVAETDVFMLSLSTMSTISCQPLCVKYEKPMFLISILADRAMEENSPWTFRVCPGDKDIAATHGQLLKFLYDQTGYEIKTYAMLYTSDDYGLGLPASYGAGAAAMGAECVVEEVIQQGQTTDVSGVISKIRQAKPDIILASCTTLEAGLVCKALKQFDVKAPMVTAGSGFAETAFFEQIGPHGADGIISCQTYLPDLVEYGPDPELAKKWIDRAESELGVMWTEQHVHGWVVIGALLDGIDLAEDTDGQSLLAAFAKMDLSPDRPFNWYTLYAGCKFGEKDGRYNQNIHAGCVYGQVQDDIYRLVWNPSKELDAAKNPLVWPIASWQENDWATTIANLS